MKLFKWRENNWWQRGTLIMTILLVVLLSSHPELRLFLPLIDVLGLDLLLILVTSQFLDYIKPSLWWCYGAVLLPVAGKLRSVLLFLDGPFGHCVTVKSCSLHSRIWPNYLINGTSE